MSHRQSPAWLALGFLALLAGCGNDGKDGEPGTPVSIDIGNATEINATINRVTIASPPVVDFTLTDGSGKVVANLPASAISFKLAKLIPGTDGNASAWQSYINRIEEPGVGPGTGAEVQATTENGNAGVLEANDDGSYSYTFALDITDVQEPVPVPFESTLTHRVSFEIRGFAPVKNPSYDFRPSDNATSGLFTREIADTATCNRCHENLSLHGGARFEMRECVTCHNPGSADANSGNTVDMTVMTHRIHHGENLPSVIDGNDYCIWGFMDFQHCYGDVVHPQDIRNCSNCHDADNEDTPDAANWYERPTAEACGACHDDVNFTTGVNHGPGIPTDNAQCVTCHASDPDSAIEVRQAHRMRAMERVADYRLNIVDIALDGPLPDAPTVTFSVTNPAAGDTPYDLATDPDLTASNLRFVVAWDTLDYSNAGGGTDNAQPSITNIYTGGALDPAVMTVGDRVYSLVLSNVPATATGSGIVTFEGRVPSADGNVPVTTTFRYFGITDDPANPVARRTSVSMDRCNDCHAPVSFHGGNRNNSIESCQVCHTAEAAGSGNPVLPMDMKHFLHRLHAVDPIRYPQRASNCLACHTDDGFYPVEADSGVRATSVNRGTALNDPLDNDRSTANTTVCGVCHTSTVAEAHMRLNGGSFTACQDTNGVVTERDTTCGAAPGPVLEENCTICHGPGRSADVAVSHSLN